MQDHLMDAVAGDGAMAQPAAEPAAPAAAPALDPAAAAAAAPAAPATPSSLLARGSAPAAAVAAARAEAAPAAAAVPEKYLVKREDGSVDHEATALKVAEGYRHLERKLGSGDAPPKSPDDYAPELPAGITMDALKSDPLYTGFLKGAHAKGMTNAQLTYVLDAFAARQQMQASPEAAEAELRKEWVSDQQMHQGLGAAFRAFKAYAGSDEEAQRLEQKFGSDPDFIRFTARIGKELAEDKPPAAAMSPAEALTLESIYKHPGYFDHKHPEHGKLVAQAKALNEKRTGGR